MRYGDPKPAFFNFSVTLGTEISKAFASSTSSLSAFFGMRFKDVTPRDSNSARTCFCRSTKSRASKICLTSAAVSSFLSGTFTSAFLAAAFLTGLTGLTGAFFAADFLVDLAALAGAFFLGARVTTNDPFDLF